MYKRQWIVKEADSAESKELCENMNILPLTAKLLCVRGQNTVEKAKAFVEQQSDCLHDPYLLKDMDRAVARLKKAIEKKERVCIYGDYDVDGVTATTILYTYLTEKGIPCIYFIPGRLEDGYGLNLRAIEELKGKVDLVITVDTGITAVEEAEYARSIGIDMVITDHHRCREVLPEATAVVNPHRMDCDYPFKQLAGVGVVFKLLAALENDSKAICERFGDVIAIGTIADVMPIVGENRYIAAMGINRLKNTDNLGLRALMESCGVISEGVTVKKINSSTVGYVLAPRINAAGRIRNAKMAVELLLSKDPAQAKELADGLCDINRERQATELKIFEQATAQLKNYKHDSVYVLNSDGWHQGVIGVVASRITEKYMLPSILFSFDGDIGKGSGRSVKGFSIMEALKACDDLLIEYGGHELAAGLTIERSKLDEFRRRINEYAKEKLTDDLVCPPIEIDSEISAENITLRQAKELLLLEPFGLQNPVPLFLLKNAKIIEAAPLAGGKHVKLRLKTKNSDKILGAVYFGMQYNELPFKNGDVCDLAFTLEVNEYRGLCEPKMFVRYIRPAESEEADAAKQIEYYQKALDPQCCDDLPKSCVPTLSQFRVFFRLVKREVGTEKLILALKYLQRQLKEVENTDVSLCALRIILDVFVESKLAVCSYKNGGTAVEIELLPFAGKINLDASPLLVKIKKKNDLI